MGLRRSNAYIERWVPSSACLDYHGAPSNFAITIFRSHHPPWPKRTRKYREIHCKSTRAFVSIRQYSMFGVTFKLLCDLQARGTCIINRLHAREEAYNTIYFCVHSLPTHPPSSEAAESREDGTRHPFFQIVAAAPSFAFLRRGSFRSIAYSAPWAPRATTGRLR